MGRPAHGAVDRPGRPTWPVSTNLGQKKHVKIFFEKSFIFSENSVKLVLTFYIQTQTSDKNFKTIYQQYQFIFVSCKFYQKPKPVFF